MRAKQSPGRDLNLEPTNDNDNTNENEKGGWCRWGNLVERGPMTANQIQHNTKYMEEWLWAVGSLRPLGKIDVPWVIVGVLSCFSTRIALILWATR